jgi:hypothetical protein
MSFLTPTSAFTEVFSRLCAGVWSLSFFCCLLFATFIGFKLWLKFSNASSTGDTDTSENSERDGRLGLRVLHEDKDPDIEYALIL